MTDERPRWGNGSCGECGYNPCQCPHVIWCDQETGVKIIRCREYNRPVWLLNIGTGITDEQYAAMFERYREWKAANDAVGND